MLLLHNPITTCPKVNARVVAVSHGMWEWMRAAPWGHIGPLPQKMGPLSCPWPGINARLCSDALQSRHRRTFAAAHSCLENASGFVWFFLFIGIDRSWGNSPRGSALPSLSGTVKTPTTLWPCFLRLLYTSWPNRLWPMMASFSLFW